MASIASKTPRFVPRREGPEKLTGRALYVDDIHVEGMWHGLTIRSTEAHARIVSIEFDPAVDWDAFAVVTAKDIPGANHVHLIVDDQPCLADGVVRHREEPVVLLAHSDREALLAARDAVRIEYDPLPAHFDPEAALSATDPIYGSDNVFKEIRIGKGDGAAALARADRVIEGVYRTPHQEQLYIENQGMLAEWTAPDRLTVRGSMQCPYYVVKALAPIFGLPESHVRVVQTVTGGGFGGKEEYPNLIAAHAALLSRESGHPVKLIYDRMEDLAATTKRHPSVVRHRTGVDAEGRLVAMEIDVLMDGGAYCTLSPVVLSRGAIHCAGPYRCDHIDVRARVVATNTPPNGAFRGFGAPQTIFALEVHMDRVAEALGLDPVEFRRRNAVGPGDTLATGQNVGDHVSAREALERAVTETGFESRRSEFSAANEAPRGPRPWLRRGIGLSLFHHGSGFTGSGEVMLASEAGLEVLPDGRVQVLSSQTEMGQGTRTILAQIVADALGFPADWVETTDPDTAVSPNSGPTVASRTAMVVGGILSRAAARLRSETEAAAGPCPSPEDLCAALAKRATAGRVVVRERYVQPPHVRWDDDTYRGDAYAAYGWSCQVAEVEVDLRTWETRVVAFTAVQDVGRVIHPVLAGGQVEGGVLQGIGYALYEEVVMEGGAMANRTLTNYIIPTTMDTPPIRVFFLEPEDPAVGPRGLGELPMDGPAPAIVNAIRHATGADLREIPVLPERLRAALGSGRRT